VAGRCIRAACAPPAPGQCARNAGPVGAGYSRRKTPARVRREWGEWGEGVEEEREKREWRSGRGGVGCGIGWSESERVTNETAGARASASIMMQVSEWQCRGHHLSRERSSRSCVVGDLGPDGLAPLVQMRRQAQPGRRNVQIHERVRCCADKLACASRRAFPDSRRRGARTRLTCNTAARASRGGASRERGGARRARPQ